jgi:hypothetical protein
VLHPRTSPPDGHHSAGSAGAIALSRGHAPDGDRTHASLPAWAGQSALAVGPSRLRQGMGRIRPTTVSTFFFFFLFIQISFLVKFLENSSKVQIFLENKVKLGKIQNKFL